MANIVVRVLGAVMAGVGSIILFTSMGSTDALALLWSILGMFVMAFGLTLMASGGRKERKPPPPTVTEIRCNGCDFKEIRDFEKGDYILKPVDKTCPKCGESMTIQGVYIVREEPDEKDKI
ncbi:MAG: hypothetical protein ACTSV3_00685 [Candidatus Thorarchaeota archaeon]|nr:MAG: hypothetical protein DRP09_04280 [Candidatus Thorarchaeota archaeon]RLI60158.1 MAG: hypothetical protein DRO87_00480 [Candidatus Thorarchaeota archaeon]